MSRDKIVAIVGPTAAGKSALAVRLAIDIGGEIISADSRQVYRYMDIGTAKPSKFERKIVPHHLVDIVDPDEEYNLAIFLREARAAIHKIHSKSKIPILVGGTGQYVWGLLEGWQVPAIQPDLELRRVLQDRQRLVGSLGLYKELSEVDPVAACRIDPRNPRRIIRALEIVYQSNNTDYSTPPQKSRVPPDFTPIVLGIRLERTTLDKKIDDRVDRMIEDGWIDEVQRLMGRGYSMQLPSMSGLGYREIASYIAGELSKDETVVKIKNITRKFVKQQHTWFKFKDQRIMWFEGSRVGLNAALDRVKTLILRGGGGTQPLEY